MMIVAGLFALLVFLGIALGPSLTALAPSATITGSTLQGLASRSTVAWANYAAGALSDFFLLPAILALFFALGKHDRYKMLLATTFFLLYILLDIVVTGFDFAGLITVSQTYSVGSSATQSSDLSVATYLHRIISLSQPISSGALSVGILLTTHVLRPGTFGKGTVYLGAAAGVIGLVYAGTAALQELAAFSGLSAILELLWFAWIGIHLFTVS